MLTHKTHYDLLICAHNASTCLSALIQAMFTALHLNPTGFHFPSRIRLHSIDIPFTVLFFKFLGNRPGPKRYRLQHTPTVHMKDAASNSGKMGNTMSTMLIQAILQNTSFWRVRRRAAVLSRKELTVTTTSTKKITAWKLQAKS